MENKTQGEIIREVLEEQKIVRYKPTFAACMGLAMDRFASQEKRIEAIGFAYFLISDYEMVSPGGDDLLWQLAGTKQNYTTEQLYEIYKKGV